MKSLKSTLLIFSLLIISSCSSPENVAISTTNASELNSIFDPVWFNEIQNRPFSPKSADSLAIEAVALVHVADSMEAIQAAKSKALQSLFERMDDRAESWKEKSTVEWTASKLIKLRRSVLSYSQENVSYPNTMARSDKGSDGYYGWASASLDQSKFIQYLKDTFE